MFVYFLSPRDSVLAYAVFVVYQTASGGNFNKNTTSSSRKRPERHIGTLEVEIYIFYEINFQTSILRLSCVFVYLIVNTADFSGFTSTRAHSYALVKLYITFTYVWWTQGYKHTLARPLAYTQSVTVFYFSLILRENLLLSSSLKSLEF